MDLEAVQLFALVAKEGSLQAAARTGSASRTTIRRKLNELEEQLGIPLMVRGAQGVELTEAGKMLAHRAEELIQQFELLAASAREIAIDAPRPIRILLPLGAPSKGHSLVFRMLRELWPGVRVDLHQDGLAGSRGCQDYDICVTLLDDVPKGPYRIVDVLTFDWCLLASPTYLENSPPVRTLQDLQAHPLLAWDDPEHGVPATLVGRKSGESAPFSPGFVSNDIELLHDMVANDDGIALTAHQDLTDEDRARYVRVLTDEIHAERRLRILISDAVADSPRIKFLLNAIADFARRRSF